MSSTSIAHPLLLDNSSVDARTAHALALLDAGAVTPDGGPGLYVVRSQHDAHTIYHVDLTIGSCDCPDYAHRRPARCKHLEAVWLARWEQRVCQLSEQHGISLSELKRRIERNVVMNDHASPAQVQAVEAICRIWARQRAQREVQP